MAFTHLLIFLSLYILIKVSTVAATCKIDVHELPKTHKAPLLLKPGNPVYLDYTYHQPDVNGIITLNKNDRIIFACPGNQNLIGPGGQGLQSIDTVCLGDNKIQYVPDPRILSCNKIISPQAIQQNTRCGNGGILVIVGHYVHSKPPKKPGFVKSYTLCFEGTQLIPSFSRHAMSGVVKGLKMGERPLFESGGFVPHLKNDYDNSEVYLKTYLKLEKYTRENKLTKGHVVPRGDFPFAAQQDSTFLFENTAPQWESINSGNWEVIEAAFRRLAHTRRNLNVATGTWGVARLRDVNQILKPLFLNGNQRVPVPALFWKVAYDPTTKEGVAIFGSNNPYFSLKAVDVPDPCPTSVCRKLMGWLRLSPNNIQSGEVVCCEIGEINPELRISSLPNNVLGLILN